MVAMVAAIVCVAPGLRRSRGYHLHMSNVSWVILIYLVMAVVLGPVNALIWLVGVGLLAGLVYLVVSLFS